MQLCECQMQMSNVNYGPGCGSRACTVSTNSCSAYLCNDDELMVMNCVWLLLWGSIVNSSGNGGAPCTSWKSSKTR